MGKYLVLEAMDRIVLWMIIRYTKYIKSIYIVLRMKLESDTYEETIEYDTKITKKKKRRQGKTLRLME